MTIFRRLFFSRTVLPLLALAVATPAWAATVKVKSGEVFIDRGSGYAKVPGSTQGKAGDTVMTMVGGSGVIIYDDGCQQAVEIGSIAVIGESSPCAAGVVPGGDYSLVLGGLAVAGVVGLAIGLSGGDDNDKKPASK